jgi:O-acetyl-ADP-ribose deacetylase (regulator of RNase III)
VTGLADVKAATRSTSRWKNTSVKLLAGEQDPVTVIIERARVLVREALDRGWSGPPFDPRALASILGIPVVASDDVRDARTVPTGDAPGIVIEFNPNRSPGRVRYSLAHELAHTLFADCAEQVRDRARHVDISASDWELEALCNIAAAEFVMPVAAFPAAGASAMSFEQLLDLRREWDVSIESLLIRAVQVSSRARAVFAAARVEEGVNAGRYRLDYVIGSPASPSASLPFSRGTILPSNSIVEQCRAIGYTAKGEETWATGGSEAALIECVGLPPYPNSRYPRVAGLVSVASAREPLLTFVRGDALEPRGPGNHLVVQVVNDRSLQWGGGGFATAVRRRFPAAHDAFQKWAQGSPDRLRLAAVHFAPLSPGVELCSMVAQHGIGGGHLLRLRYEALQECLRQAAAHALKEAEDVHMPRIGSGLAGGSWDLVQEIVVETLCQMGINVTVYELPPDRASRGLIGQERTKAGTAAS